MGPTYTDALRARTLLDSMTTEDRDLDTLDEEHARTVRDHLHGWLADEAFRLASGTSRTLTP